MSFLDWDFDADYSGWEEPVRDPMGYVSLRMQRVGKAYREAWERYTGEPWDSPNNVHFKSVFIGGTDA